MRRARALALSAAAVVVLVVSACGATPDDEPPQSSASSGPSPVSPAPSPAIGVACSTAQQLTTDGYPQRAVALVDALNAQVPDAAPECVPEYAVALARIEQASRSAAAAETARASEDKQELAGQALALDRQNSQAQTVLDSLGATAVDQRATWWEGRTADTLAPLSVLAVRTLALAAVLLVLARLSVGLFPDIGRTRPKVASFVWYTGIASVIAGSALAVALFRAPAAGSWGVFGAVLAGVGTLMTGWGAARRLRLRVTATKEGKTDDAAAAHVLALLDDLGASRPQGLERPQGADVQGLAAVFDAIPDNPVAKALKSALTLVTGWQPWHVRVEEEAGGTVAVAITRNGRTRGGAVIDVQAMDLPASVRKDGKLTVDSHRFVAAVVITELARNHRGFDGLCGASDWQALGMHYLATTDFKDDPPTAQELLATAVERDPDNMLAQVALASRLWRRSTEPAQLRRYLAWLDNAYEHMTVPGERDRLEAGQHAAARPGHQHLRARVQVSRSAVSINAAFQQAYATRAKVDLTTARSAVARLCVDLHRLENRPGRKPADPWLVESRATAAAYTVLWGGPQAFAAGDPTIPSTVVDEIHEHWDHLPRGPKAHYMRGCSLATAALVNGTVLDPAARAPRTAGPAAVDELVQGAALPWLARWLTEDPQLQGFRESTAYREAFAPEPRTDLLALAPFADLAEVLRPLGLDRASAWAHLSPDRVADATGIPGSRARLLAELADLARSLEHCDTLGPLAIELLDLLFAKGLRRRADITGLARAARITLAGKWAETLHAYVRKDEPTTEELEGALTAWLHRPPRR